MTQFYRLFAVFCFSQQQSLLKKSSHGNEITEFNRDRIFVLKLGNTVNQANQG